MQHTLNLSRDLFVPRDLVFQVWTQPEHLSAWYSPTPDCARDINVDPQPGGQYMFTWTTPDGSRFVQRGVYRSVDAPTGFHCSQRFEAGFGATFDTELSITLADEAGSTCIDIRQQGFPTGAARDNARQLWSQLLDQLEAYFSVI